MVTVEQLRKSSCDSSEMCWLRWAETGGETQTHWLVSRVDSKLDNRENRHVLMLLLVCYKLGRFGKVDFPGERGEWRNLLSVNSRLNLKLDLLRWSHTLWHTRDLQYHRSNGNRGVSRPQADCASVQPAELARAAAASYHGWGLLNNRYFVSHSFGG